MINELNDLYNGKTISDYNFSRGNALFNDIRGISMSEDYNKSDSSLHKTVE